MTDTNTDRRALAERVHPIAGAALPWERASIENNPQRRVTEQALERAKNAYAGATAAVAAQLLREAFPTAEQVMFERIVSDDGDGTVKVEIVAVFDAKGALVWYETDSDYWYHPGAVAQAEDEAYGGPVLPEFEVLTRDACATLIAKAGDGWFSPVDGFLHTEGSDSPDWSYTGDLYEVVVSEAIADATDAEKPAPTSPGRVGRTWYGKRDGFDYESFVFTAEFPPPTVWVLLGTAAYFRGPDGYLWFIPGDGTTRCGGLDWNRPQNVAEYDQRMRPGVDTDEPRYLDMVTELCLAVDHTLASQRWMPQS